MSRLEGAIGRARPTQRDVAERRCRFHRGCCLVTSSSTSQVAWPSIDLAATIARLHTCDECRHLRTGIIRFITDIFFAGKHAAKEVGEG